MWIDTPFEGIMWGLFVMSFLFALGIESEKRVRESWLASLNYKKHVNESELKQNLKANIADCSKKSTRWFIFAIVIMIVLLIFGTY